MKWRCMFPESFIEVEAETEEAAQNMAAARLMPKPMDFIVWPAGEAIRSVGGHLDHLPARPKCHNCGQEYLPAAGFGGYIPLCKCVTHPTSSALVDSVPATQATLCSDCPPVGYPTDKTRCATCPRHSQVSADPHQKP